MGRDSGGSEPVRDALFSPNHRKGGRKIGRGVAINTLPELLVHSRWGPE